MWYKLTESILKSFLPVHGISKHKGADGMGFMDFVLAALNVADMFADHDTHFEVTCDTLEIFEIGTSWRGTARVHGAGAHLRTESVDYTTRLTMPEEDDYNRTRRSILRDRLLKWASDTFADGAALPKEAIVLNESENCISCEGFAKQVGGRWVITTSMRDAKCYCSYKLFLETGGKSVGYEELHRLFKADTVGYVTQVDVRDGF